MKRPEYTGLGVGYLHRLIDEEKLDLVKGAGPRGADVVRRTDLRKIMKRASENLPTLIEESGIKPLTQIQERLLEAAQRSGPPVQLYQHTVFCQTSLRLS